MIALPIPQVISTIKILWKYKTLVALGLSVGVLGYYAHLAERRGVERDAAETSLASVKETLDNLRAVSDQKIAALERKVEDDNERSYFEQESARLNEAGRVMGDGPLAPVLRDGLGRLRKRQAAFRNQRP